MTAAEKLYNAYENTQLWVHDSPRFIPFPAVPPEEQDRRIFVNGKHGIRFILPYGHYEWVQCQNCAELIWRSLKGGIKNWKCDNCTRHGKQRVIHFGG